MNHDRHQHRQTRPKPGYVGHYEHEKQLEKNLPNPNQHGEQRGRNHHSHEQHGGHDKHAGHSPDMFKQRFFLCLLLTLPVLYFSPMFQHWFSYQAIQFPGMNWITPILSTIIYFYGAGFFYEELGMNSAVVLNSYGKDNVMKNNFRERGIDQIKHEVSASAGWILVTDN